MEKCSCEAKLDKILENQKEILQKLDWLYIQCVPEERMANGKHRAA